MFKLGIKKAFCTLMMFSIFPVLAAGDVEAKTIGTLKAVGCFPTLGGGGVIDYGEIEISALNEFEYTILQAKSTDFAIKCDAPTKVALKAISNRVGTLAGAIESPSGSALISSVSSTLKLFNMNDLAVIGLGTTDNNAKIGGYAMRFTPMSLNADGNTVERLFIEEASIVGPWMQGNYGGLIGSSSTVYTSWSAKGTINPISFTNLTGSLEVQVFINKTSELDLTKPITLDGSATLELIYL